MSEEEVEFIEACESGDEEKVTKMINSGIDVDCHDCFGVTALAGACKNNRLNIAKLLLKHGADINFEGEDNFTALSEVYNIIKEPCDPKKIENYKEIIDFLIESGGKVTPENRRLSWCKGLFYE